MPVVAVGFAAVAIATAVATLETFAIVAAVGATIAAIGAVTNNQTLMIAGGVVGAIGGIGALATSAGLFGSSIADVASGTSGGAGSAASSGIDSEISQWSQYGSTLAADGSPAAGAASLSGAPSMAQQSDVIDTVTGGAQPVEGSTGPVLASADAPNVAPAAAIDNSAIPQASADGTFTASGSDTASLESFGQKVPEVGAPSAPTVPGDSTATTNSILKGGQGTSIDPRIGPADYGPGGASAGAGVTGRPAVEIGAGTAGTSSGSSGIWDTITGLLDKKGAGTLLSGVVQAGSSFISGATNGLTPAQIAALNAQAQANQAAANLSNRQQANMAEPLPVASRAPPITGAPAGLINTPPPRIPVTGAA